MALEFICSNVIENNEKIKIPWGALGYRLKSGKIKFFKANPHMEGAEWIPMNAKQVSFDIERYSFHISYGKACFYDTQGNALNMGDC